MEGDRGSGLDPLCSVLLVPLLSVRGVERRTPAVALVIPGFLVLEGRFGRLTESVGGEGAVGG